MQSRVRTHTHTCTHAHIWILIGHGFKFGPAVGEILARLALHDSDDIQSQPPYLLGEGIGKKMVQIKSGGESSDSDSSERNALRSAQEKMSIFSIRRFFSEKYAGFAGHDFKIDLSAR